jgi:hypothetical protein
VPSQPARVAIEPAPEVITKHLRVLAAVSTSDGEPAGRVRLDTLGPADSPRLDGVNTEHVRALAEAAAEFPPILVQRSTMRVIDGMHRLSAARRKGQPDIGVEFFDCTDEEAFVLAVAANATDGLPLTGADRRAAAVRIMRHRPEASDRLIAELTGLTPKAVGGIRRRAAETLPKPAKRVGRDGRIRPVDPSGGRRIASQILAADPGASLREIARMAGISIGTAHDVREKIRRGSDPVSPRGRKSARYVTTGQGNRANGQADLDAILRRLRHDPALRYSESGRSVLGWFCGPRLLTAADWQDVIDRIPPHCRFEIVQLASGCAAVWSDFAAELERRNR